MSWHCMVLDLTSLALLAMNGFVNQQNAIKCVSISPIEATEEDDIQLVDTLFIR